MEEEEESESGDVTGALVVSGVDSGQGAADAEAVWSSVAARAARVSSELAAVITWA